MVITSVKEFLFDRFIKIVLSGCQTVEPENKRARIDKCKKCPYFGTVEPAKGIRMNGCTVCGCPLETKASLKEIPRLYAGEPITVSELAEMQKQKLADSSKIEMELVDCPHPDGSQWQEIDSQFKT